MERDTNLLRDGETPDWAILRLLSSSKVDTAALKKHTTKGCVSVLTCSEKNRSKGDLESICLRLKLAAVKSISWHVTCSA
jgi:hypothetical protein